MPMLSALDLVEARGLPRWISLSVDEIEAETLDRFEQNNNESTKDVATDDTDSVNMLISLDSVLEDASINRNMSLLSKIEAANHKTSHGRRHSMETVHSRTWCSSKVKHRARGLCTSQTNVPLQANATYTNSFAGPSPSTHRHSRSFPSWGKTELVKEELGCNQARWFVGARRNSWAGATSKIPRFSCI